MKVTHRKAIEALQLGVSRFIGKRDQVISHYLHLEGGYTEHIKVWLYHGNMIAKVESNGKTYVSWQGWFTQSTSERINALADYFNLPRPEKREGWVELTA